MNGEAEEKKELQLVDEVGGNDGVEEPEPMEADCIVLSEEVTGDDEREVKKEAAGPGKTELTASVTGITETEETK